MCDLLHLLLSSAQHDVLLFALPSLIMMLEGIQTLFSKVDRYAEPWSAEESERRFQGTKLHRSSPVARKRRRYHKRLELYSSNGHVLHI